MFDFKCEEKKRKKNTRLRDKIYLILDFIIVL